MRRGRQLPGGLPLGALALAALALAGCERSTEANRGLPTRPTASQPVPLASAAAAPLRALGAGVSGVVELAPTLRAKLPANAQVVISAYAVDGPRIALAQQRHPADTLPLPFTLDDAGAVNPAFRLSAAVQVVVRAHVNSDGRLEAAPGDWQGASGVVPVGTRGLRITIDAAARR